MKNIFIIMPLFMVLVFVLCACTTAIQSDTIETVEIVEKTPIEELNENEKILFDAFIKMSEGFFEPAALRLLEVGDYKEPSGIDYVNEYSGDYMGDGLSNLVTIKLQGENRIGGTTTKYYLIRLDTPERYISKYPKREADVIEKAERHCDKYWEESKDNYKNRDEYLAFLIDGYSRSYCKESEAEKYFGYHRELSDYTTIDDKNTDMYDVAKINRAFVYYWNDRLGN